MANKTSRFNVAATSAHFLVKSASNAASLKLNQTLAKGKQLLWAAGQETTPIYIN